MIDQTSSTAAEALPVEPTIPDRAGLSTGDQVSRTTVPAGTVRNTPGVWVIRIPTPCQWLTANYRGHHMAKARIEKQWREAAYQAALAVRPPKGLGRVRVDVLFQYGRSPVREIENLRPTLKNCVDGAIGPQRATKKGISVGYGIVIDDSDKHLVYGDYQSERVPLSRYAAEVNPYTGAVVLTVTDIGGSSHVA